MDELFMRLKLNLKLTHIIIAIYVFIWLAMELVGGSTNSSVLLIFGALERSLVFGGEYWRMLSNAFLHIGFIHLLVNSYTLYNIGIFIENFFGQKKFIATYVITSVTASILSLILSFSISAGASGALFGLVGLILGNSFAKKIYSVDLPIDERQLIPFVLYNLFFGFSVPGINNWAHIGGLLGGIALGYLLDPSASFDPSIWKKTISQVLGYLSYGLLFVTFIFWVLNIWGFSIINY